MLAILISIKSLSEPSRLGSISIEHVFSPLASPNMHLIHDLRNLLSIAAVCVANLRAATDANRCASADMDVLSHCLDSLFELVDEFFSTTPIAAVTDHEVAVDRVVEERVEILRAAIGTDVELKIEPSAVPAMVKARPIDLERILLNLVLNGSEAMPDGGVLTVRTELVDAHAPDPNLLGLPRAFVRLTVADTGRGMPSGWEQDLFKLLAFNRAGGRGLGLASVKLLVFRLGGRFHIESHWRHGTRVHVDLPQAPPSREPATPS